MTDASKSKWEKYGIVLLLFAAACLGTLSLWSRYFIFTDGTVYAALAKNLADGVGLRYCGGVHLFYPPGYPVAIAFLYGLLRNEELAGHLVSFFAYMGSVLITLRLAKSLRRSVPYILASGFIVVFHPYFILYASYVMSESLFVCVVLGGAFCAWKLAAQNKPAIWIWILWSLLGGYAYLIRADGVVYWPLQAIFILCRQRFQKRAILFVSGAAVLFALVLFPYLHLIKQETGKWQLSTKTSILLEFSRMKMLDGTARGETRQTSQLSEDGKTFAIDRADETLGSFILNHPGEAFERVAWNWKRLFFRNGLVFSWLTLPAAAALIWILRKRILSIQSAFLIVHVFPVTLFSLFYIDDRFILTFVPFFALAYGRIFEWGIQWMARVPRKRLVVVAAPLIIALAASSAVFLKPRLSRIASRVFPSGLPLEHKAMGLWMRDNVSVTPTTRISHRNPWVSFYAGGCHKRTPNFDMKQTERARAERLVQWCRNAGVDYVVVDERMTLPYMPELVFLLEEDREYLNLKRIKTLGRVDSKIVLYSVTEEDSTTP